MTPDRHDTPPPLWVRVWMPVAIRLGLFVVGATVVVRDPSTEAHIGAGVVLMLASAGAALPAWLRARGPR